jgi:hypothetical protein
MASRAHWIHGGIVTAILLAAGILNMLELPHPTWVWICGVIAFVASGAAGTLLIAPSAAAPESRYR